MCLALLPHVQNPSCAAYTWYWYHYYYEWEYTCVGRSDRYDILGYDNYGYAGVRSSIGDDGEGEACTHHPNLLLHTYLE